MSDRFIVVSIPDERFEYVTKYLVIDRGPEEAGLEGSHLRERGLGAVAATCHDSPSAHRIAKALDVAPGDTALGAEPF